MMRIFEREGFDDFPQRGCFGGGGGGSSSSSQATTSNDTSQPTAADNGAVSIGNYSSVNPSSLATGSGIALSNGSTINVTNSDLAVLLAALQEATDVTGASLTANGDVTGAALSTVDSVLTNVLGLAEQSVNVASQNSTTALALLNAGYVPPPSPVFAGASGLSPGLMIALALVVALLVME